MEMTGLRVLSSSMLNNRIDMQGFIHKAGAAEFYCIYSLREDPNILSLTSRGENPVFIKREVVDFRIKTFLGDQFKDLRRVLFVDGRAGVRLEPQAFFAELNRTLPREANARSVPTSREILEYRHDMEERDRPYFLRYETRGRGPSLRNQAKTAALIGAEALKFSIASNQSSIWSDIDPAERR